MFVVTWLERWNLIRDTSERLRLRDSCLVSSRWCERPNSRVVVVVAVATLVVLAGCASVTPDSGEPDGECPTPTAYEQKPLPD